jgi:FlaA1/EpsC-like NDP-sugar epimerase
MLLAKIFKNHYNKTYAYILDVLSLAFAIKVLLQLNGATVIINQYQDLAVYGVLAILGIRLMGGYSMMLRFTSLLDVSRIAAGQFRYLVLLFYFSITVLVAYRVGVRLLYHRSIAVTEKTPTLLFGAGTNGLNAQRALMNSSSIQVLGFVDDDPAKIGRSIEGLPVYGMKGLAAVVAKKEVAQVVLTSEKLSVGRKKELFDFLSALGVKVFTVPSVDQWVQGGAQGNALKSIKIEDLLKRDAIAIDLARNKAVYAGKRILVTGAAGSIGAEIVTQLLPFGPAELLLLDAAETPLFHLKNQLGAQYAGKVSYHVASVLDHQYLERLFQDPAGIDVVFHAAAYKHVFMMEQQPQAAILNNILGTKQLIDLSIEHQVAQLVLVSTDKAVNPSNVMGASKRIAELYLAACMEKAGQTKLITTRFGNVLGSNGSVVPIFSAQIAAGGPVTVTHPEITRYFMTIPEACQLVLEAGAIGAGGEVFVFDMGDPVKIKDLAVNMIRLSGMVEDQDIKIEYSGLRPGEKLYEELLTDKEDLLPSHNPLIFKAKKETQAATLASGIAVLLEMAAQGATAEALVKQMKKLVPEFKSMHSPFEKLD